MASSEITQEREISKKTFCPLYLLRSQGGLEALPMIQRVKVRASFHRCKQNLVIIQGKSQVFTWLFISNFDSEIVLKRSRFDFPSMVIAIVLRHLALLLEKQRVERADG